MNEFGSPDIPRSVDGMDKALAEGGFLGAVSYLQGIWNSLGPADQLNCLTNLILALHDADKVTVESAREELSRSGICSKDVFDSLRKMLGRDDEGQSGGQ